MKNFKTKTLVAAFAGLSAAGAVGWRKPST
jgi:hypothetical protein